MSNLIILYLMIAITCYLFMIAFKCIKYKEGARKAFITKTITIFFIHGLIWVPCAQMHGLKNIGKQMSNVAQNVWIGIDLKGRWRKIDRRIEKKTDKFIPKIVKKVLGPLQRQTAEVGNSMLGMRTPKAKPGLWQKIGGAVSGIKNFALSTVAVIL